MSFNPQDLLAYQTKIYDVQRKNREVQDQLSQERLNTVKATELHNEEVGILDNSRCN